MAVEKTVEAADSAIAKVVVESIVSDASFSDEPSNVSSSVNKA